MAILEPSDEEAIEAEIRDMRRKNWCPPCYCGEHERCLDNGQYRTSEMGIGICLCPHDEGDQRDGFSLV